MGEGGDSGLTPDQRAERFSTEGLDFEASLRRVSAGGREEEGQEMGEHSGVAERELTDEQVIEAWESMTAGIRDGSIQTFNDPAALREDIRRRFGM